MNPVLTTSPGKWTKRSVCPITGNNKRGRLAVSKAGDLYLILPDSTEPAIRILKTTKADCYSTYEEVWAGRGYTGEPLVDSARLETEGTLSLFIRAEAVGESGRLNVAVLDFEL